LEAQKNPPEPQPISSTFIPKFPATPNQNLKAIEPYKNSIKFAIFNRFLLQIL
jgi:hypothetical protein